MNDSVPITSAWLTRENMNEDAGYMEKLNTAVVKLLLLFQNKAQLGKHQMIKQVVLLTLRHHILLCSKTEWSHINKSYSKN